MSRDEATERPGGEGRPSWTHCPHSMPQLQGAAPGSLLGPSGLSLPSFPHPGGRLFYSRGQWGPGRAVTGQHSALAFLEPETTPAPSAHPSPQILLLTFSAWSFFGQPLPQWLPIYAQGPPWASLLGREEYVWGKRQEVKQADQHERTALGAPPPSDL